MDLNKDIVPDLIFTAIPVLNMKMDDLEATEKVIKNKLSEVFKYAESRMGPGYVIIYIDESYRGLLPETILSEIDPIYWLKPRQKKLEGARRIFIWKTGT